MKEIREKFKKYKNTLVLHSNEVCLLTSLFYDKSKGFEDYCHRLINIKGFIMDASVLIPYIGLKGHITDDDYNLLFDWWEMNHVK